MLAQSTAICPPKTYTEPCLIFCRHPLLDDKVSAIASKAIDLSNSCKPSTNPSYEYEDFSVAQFIRFLKQIKLKKVNLR